METRIWCHIKVRRIRLAGHMTRLEESDPAKLVLESQIYGIQEVGRPKLRWIGWVAQDRMRLRRIVAEAKTRSGF